MRALLLALARALHITVLEHRALELQLCAEGCFTAMTCRRAWLPVWVCEAHDARSSLATIAWCQRAAQKQITPLWDAICDEARAEVPEDDRITVCPME